MPGRPLEARAPSLGLVEARLVIAGLAVLLATLLPSAPAAQNEPDVEVVAALSSINAAFSQAPLVQASDGNFYGTSSGGQFGLGDIFRMLPDGTLQSLHSFNGPNGWSPVSGLTQASDGYLYGTTLQGGANGWGTVFRISTSGSFEALHSFVAPANNEGYFPRGGVTQASDGNLYGTASSVVFRFVPTGRAFSVYAAIDGNCNGSLSGLVEGADGRLYGAGVNCLYVVNANGTTSVLQQMSLSQGGGLQGTLIQGADGALYGTAIAGGAFAADNPSAPCNTFSGCGSVFRYDILADQFSVLFSFDGGLNGNAPIGGLFQASDGLLYGTTSLGGQNGHGTVFSISTSGGLETFHHFDNAGGSEPRATLSEGSDGQLYSTTYDGGVNPAFGVVYRVTLPPPPDTTPPVVTPPAALTVDAVSLSGISGDQSPALRGFLAGGSATDDIDPAPVRLTPQVGGVDATSATVFPVGTSTVTFRYHDGGGNVGTATSDVTVISPQRRIVGSGANAPEPKLSASFSVDVTGPFAPSGSLEYVTTTTSPNGAPRVKVQLVSTSLTSVTVNGGTMTIEGTGTIGKGVYTFTATITDGAADQLGIVIRRQNGNVYYSASAAPLTSGGVTLTIPD